MAEQNDTPFLTFTAGGAISQYLRVKLSTGKLAAAGAEDEDVGTIEEASFADGDIVTVRAWNAEGTRKMVASGSISQFAKVYGAASGKISATANGKPIGIAMQAASNDGDWIEVYVIPATGLRFDFGQATTVAASDTIATGLSEVIAVIAGFDDNPGDDPNYVSASIGDQAGTPAAGSFLLKTWKNTGGTDPTPLAATTFSKKVNWIAVGK